MVFGHSKFSGLMLGWIRAGLAVLLLAGLAASAQTTVSSQLCNTTSPCFPNLGYQFCPAPVPAYSAYVFIPAGISSSGDYFNGLPSFAKITHVRVALPMTAGIPGRTAGVSVSLNDQAIGAPQVVGGSPGTCGAAFPSYVFEQDFPTGLTNYNRTGMYVVRVSVAQSDVQTAIELEPYAGIIDVTYVPGVDIQLLSGDGQTGCVGSPPKSPLRVRLISSPDIPLAGKKVTFTVSAQPAKASAVVGVDENAASATFTADADATGTAEAVLVFGASAGTYSVEDESPDSVEPKKITFTGTAAKPAFVRVFKDAIPATSLAQASFAVSPVEMPRFYAYGIDGANHPIGPMKATWSSSSSGKTSLRGSATLTPSLGTTSSVLFNPTHAGFLQLSATPVVSVGGLKGGNATIDITGVLVDVSGNFAATQKDESALFIPGSSVSGGSLPLPSATGVPIQLITLHFITPASAKGSVQYRLTNVTHYPGIAMNYPVGNPSSSPDMAFAAGSDELNQTTARINFDPSGDTATQLLIYDYAAYGHLTATVNTDKGVFTIEKDLPELTIDGLPVAGWQTAAGKVSTAALPASTDFDTGVNGYYFGDGLTAFEEYRGFSIAGGHLRTDPRVKDIFVDIDFELLSMGAINMLPKLSPLRVHYLNPEDTAHSDFVGNYSEVSRVRPVINANRSGISSSRPQRAVRIASVTKPPQHTDTTTGLSAAQFLFSFGRQFNDSDSLDTTEAPYQGNGPAPPTETQVVEYYPQAFEIDAIAYGPNGVLDSLSDLDGNPVCYTPGSPLCDIRDDADLFVRRSGLLLMTVLNQGSDDYYTEIAYRDCARSSSPVAASQEDVEQLKIDVVAHEMLHGVGVNHLTACGDLMYVDEDQTPTRTFVQQLPYPTDYSDADKDQIRLH